MRKYLTIYEETVSHLWLCNCSILNFLIYEENYIFFFISVFTEGREYGRLVLYRWGTVLPARSFSALLLKTVNPRWDSRRTSDSIEWIIEAQCFLPLYDLAPPPPDFPTPSPVSKRDHAVTHRKAEKERQLADERRGVGVGRIQIKRRRESLVIYKSSNTLWRTLSIKNCRQTHQHILFYYFT
jgi:hypothetical protein